MRLEFSATADAAYVYFAPGDHFRTEHLDDGRNIDYDANGRVLGIEFLGVSQGVELDGLPDAQTLERLLYEQLPQARVFA
jgi:uncharacterized protein YuzE